mgnify:CR=1 FL=1
MADYPNNPYVGQTFDHPNGQTYQFDGVVWTIARSYVPGTGIAAVKGFYDNQNLELIKSFDSPTHISTLKVN